MSRLIVGPFNRVEGDLEVSLQIDEGRVTSAQVNAPMYRGFEQILQGKSPLDALVYVPRICGICSVSQSVAAARALADLAGMTPTPNGLRVTNLMLAAESLADHVSHFYLFFMPDFCRDAYAQQAWHGAVRDAFDPQQGHSVRTALAARQRWMMLLGDLGGKWPHTQSIQPGGSSQPVDAMTRHRLLLRLAEFRQFLEQQLFGAPLEAVAECADLSELHQRVGPASDLARFLTLAHSLNLETLGPGPGRFLSYGAYPQTVQDTPASTAQGAPDPATQGTPWWSSGVWQNSRLTPLDLARISEDCTHAWLDDAPGPLHPSQGRTEPRLDKAAGYTWNKAPRLAGQVVETGALARQVVQGHPLIRTLVAHSGGNVFNRVIARLLELACVVPRMTQWVRELTPDAPYCLTQPLPEDGFGVGLTEAARGSLGHWIELQSGRIRRYQIVAPTSWNFSPRDRDGQPGALEAALVGVPVAADEAVPVAVQHIVRSFDPCMVCTVH